LTRQARVDLVPFKVGVTVEQNRRAVVLLKEAGMLVNADFIFGAPGETESQKTCSDRKT
jgi:radical SAM superfamily enzyme YgiQ (UPF0313 family)